MQFFMALGDLDKPPNSLPSTSLALRPGALLEGLQCIMYTDPSEFDRAAYVAVTRMLEAKNSLARPKAISKDDGCAM